MYAASEHTTGTMYITESRELVRVRYPSEPVPAHAAHRIFQSVNRSKCSPTSLQLKALNLFVKERTVEAGPRGELGVRFSLLRALTDVGHDKEDIQMN
jgi:hypothetical protein